MARKQKTIVKPAKIPKANAKTRKKPVYKSFRPHKRIKHIGPRLPGSWSLVKKSILLMWVNKKQIALFFLVFAVLNLILVRGFDSPFDIEGIREELSTVVDEDTLGFASSFTAFSLLLGSSSGSGNEIAQQYQLILLVIGSLAFIWLFRQQQAGNKVSMKMAFYRGMYPLIPFLLVLMVIGLQLIPALIGNYLLQTVLTSGLVASGFETVLWVIIFLFTLLLSLYMLSSSTMALYVVTLPEIAPMTALREARELVRHRRVSLILRIIGLVFVMFALLFIIILPVIYFAPVVAEWLFFAMTILGLPFVHGYMFSLYRELL